MKDRLIVSSTAMAAINQKREASMGFSLRLGWRLMHIVIYSINNAPRIAFSRFSVRCSSVLLSIVMQFRVKGRKNN